MGKKARNVIEVLDELTGDDEELKQKIAIARRESDIGNKLYQIWLQVKRGHHHKSREMVEDLMVECGTDWED